MCVYTYILIIFFFNIIKKPLYYFTSSSLTTAYFLLTRPLIWTMTNLPVVPVRRLLSVQLMGFRGNRHGWNSLETRHTRAFHRSHQHTHTHTQRPGGGGVKMEIFSRKSGVHPV